MQLRLLKNAGNMGRQNMPFFGSYTARTFKKGRFFGEWTAPNYESFKFRPSPTADEKSK